MGEESTKDSSWGTHTFKEWLKERGKANGERPRWALGQDIGEYRAIEVK